MRAVQVSRQVSWFLTAALFLAAASSAHAGDDGAWTVSKSSGEVWFTNASAQPASLKQEESLKPGDTIRTGRNGRVLLQRGEESMMISPNSVIGVPAEKKEGLSTTIQQQAGSILLEVEKRNVKHFEVETPYLAAVVKGTQFRVTVNATSTSVDVLRGQVEVADFRTGQIAQVMPGQHATTFSHGNAGLSLSGTGTLSPIEQGKPRTPSIERVPVPRAGLTAPRGTAIGQAVKPAGNTDKNSQRQAGVAHVKPGVVRISSSIGEVKLNVHKVTHGLARDKSSVNAGTRNVANKDTVWGSTGSSNSSSSSTSYVANTSAGNGASSGNTSSGTASSGNSGSGSTSGSSVSSTVATVTGAATSGSSNNGNSGNGNNGNGNGNNGANGNGGKTNNGNHGEGNNGNGNGNGGSNGNGHGKKS